MVALLLFFVSHNCNKPFNLFKQMTLFSHQLTDFSDVPCPVRSLPPQWYHTVQVRRIRALRARSNSDPLQGKNLGQGLQWVSVV